jgi:hypothetical protein
MMHGPIYIKYAGLIANETAEFSNGISFCLLYIDIVTYATLDLSNYILQNYNTCTKSQDCNKHKVVIHIK